MKVRELIEILHDCRGDTEIKVCNTASGYKGIEVTGITDEREGEDEIVLMIEDFDYMDQVKAKYRTFTFSGIARDGDFVDTTASAFVPETAVSAIRNAVQRSDKKEFRDNE